ncbi:DNA-directed RNA polymerase subunit beta (fragment) [Syntrophaceticus schinkii]|uniref:DNA-directed RNA polymerase n=1 Tax=Syntrophaceticus schinkii TaxID=499207 RepID=A0A0B7MHM9_9FIRM
MKLYHHRCRLYGKYYMKPSKVRDGVYMINPKPVQVGEKVRLSFGRISEVLEMPNMIEIQKQSHEWFLKEGLKATFHDVSPIQDFTGNLSLEFLDYSLGEPKYSVAECKERDVTFAAPLRAKVRLTNRETGEIKEQEVFMGDFPLMTDKGTFIINGAERVVVSQLVRSPGVYYNAASDASGKRIYSATVIPNRGAWIEFESDSHDCIHVRIDRTRKLPVTVLIRALGYSTNEEILENYDDDEFLKITLEKDNTQSQEDALVEIYKRLRPGEPPTVESARALLENLFFDTRRYDLGQVGRYKLNKKLELDDTHDSRCLTPEDLFAVVGYFLKLMNGTGNVDDIDHLGNRRLRSVGELLQNQFRIGLARMERVVRERMTIQDVDTITPQALINIRPVVASIKEFFGSSQLSQFMDQTNPLAELTHKRRLSALGPGGLSRERAGFEVRDVHHSHYGRMCPIETPEGPNIGLIGSLSTYARVNKYGFIETPYRKVDKEKGVVTDEIVYLTADEEDKYVVAQANAPLDEEGRFITPRVDVRDGKDILAVPPSQVDFMDVSPKQVVSVAAALIPFLENDDANRALMGANMQRQAVPLLRTEAPLVGTGIEYRVAHDSGVVVTCDEPGVVERVTADEIKIKGDTGRITTYRLTKFARSNQGTCINQKPIVKKGQRVEEDQVIADGACTSGGELALGRNVLVAYMPGRVITMRMRS